MKTYPPGYREALMAGATTAFLYSFALTNGSNAYFTDAAEDISVNGILFHCGARLKRSALSLTSGLDTCNFDLETLYNANYITKQAVKAGLYQGASYLMEQVIVDNPSLGTVPFLSGTVGAANLKRIKVIHTFNSSSNQLNTKRARVTSPNCPWDLGDMTLGKCRKNIVSFINSTTVASVTGDAEFVVNISTFLPNANVFNYGYVQFSSGLNAGLKVSIKKLTVGAGSSTIQLWTNFPYPVAINDALKLFAGCNKLLSMCDSNYDNDINFGGQPYVPGEIKATNGI